MVGVILVVVDKLVKRTPKSGAPFYTGMCVTKNDPCVMKTLRMVEPLQAIEQNVESKRRSICDAHERYDEQRQCSLYCINRGFQRILNYVLSVENFTCRAT